MERKEFIEKVGLSSASILIFGCMQACSKSDSSADPSNSNGNSNGTTNPIDFSINITIAPYNNLNNLGGFYIDAAKNIIIARTLNNDFLAVSSVCTHQQVTLEYQSNANRFYCSGHGSVFSVTGAVTTGPATQALKQYKTTLTGNTLRIYA